MKQRSDSRVDDLGAQPADDRRSSLAIAAIGAAVLLLACVPYVVGWLRTPEGHVYSWLAYACEDNHSYLAKMLQGRDGAWHYVNRYTAVEVKPVLLFMFYLFLGHASGWLAIPLEAMYHLARLLGGAAMFWSIDRASREAGLRGGARVLAFAFATTASGLAWLTWPFIKDPEPTDMWWDEAYTFNTVALFPHFPWGTAMIVLILLEAWRCGAGARPAWPTARAALWAFLLAWIHPRLLLTALVSGALAAAAGAARGHWPLRRWIPPLAAAFAAGAAPAALIALSYRGDPLWEHWAQTPLPMPNLLWLLEGFGFLWPLAAFGGWLAWRERKPGAVLLLAWLAASFLLPYLPIASQRRLGQGINLPLSMLAAIGAWRAIGLAANRWKWDQAAVAAASALLAGALAVSTVIYLVVAVQRLNKGDCPFYYSAEQVAVARWLRANAPRDAVVLSSYGTSMVTGVLAGNRLLLGHWAECHNLIETSENLRKLLHDEFKPEAARKCVEYYRIRYLALTPLERPKCKLVPESHPELWRPVWREGGAAIYEVVR